jgi:hypothetical protein
VLNLFRRQPIIRLKLEQPVQPVPRPDHAQIVLLRSAAQAERNCEAIKHAQDLRELRETQLKELVEVQRMEQQCA